MMYSVNETVLYGAQGVCRITEIAEKNFGEKKARYYVLKPVYNDTSTIFIPTENQVLTAKMRRILSSAEIDALIRSMPDEELISTDGESERREKYTDILRSGDRRQLVRLIKTLYMRQAERKEQKKKPSAEDERFMRDAEKILYEEFAYVLHIQREQVLPFITRQIQVDEKIS